MNNGLLSVPSKFELAGLIEQQDAADQYINYVVGDGGVIADEVTVRAQISQAISEGWWNDLVCWFSAAGGYRLDSGRVDKWYNYKANGLDGIQTTSGFQPTFIASVNRLGRKPAILFDNPELDEGRSLYLGNIGSHFPNAGSCFVVAETAVTESAFALFGTSYTDQWWCLGAWSPSNLFYPGVWRSARIDPAVGFTINHGVGIWDISTSSQQYIWNVNGIRSISAGGYAYSPGNDYRISDNNGANQRAFRGHIAEVMLFNSTLEGQYAASASTPVTYDGRRLSVITYLNTRYR